MPETRETYVRQMRVRERTQLSAPLVQQPTAPEWAEPEKKQPGERFWQNMAVAAALVLCAVTLRTGAIPALDSTADVVMTAATDDSLLDDDLGKLSFVSALFPEAVLVFGENGSETLSMPVSGGVVVHAWSESEPYMSWRTNALWVTSAADGEVVGVYHGNGDEQLVQVMGYDGLSCVYGNLGEVSVQMGDEVHAGDVLGTLIKGADAVFEVRRDGRSIDPALYLGR